MTDIRKTLNVFEQGVVVGQLAMIDAAGPASMSVLLDADSVATILPTYPVKLISGSAPIIEVELAIPGTDPIYGLAMFDPKKSSWVAEEVFQVTRKNAIVYLKSDEALSRGDKVGMATTAPYELIVATSSNYIGQLLDDVAIDGIARVELAIPLTVAP